MNEIRKLLLKNAERYPEMLPCDAVKLLYQNEFGGGHLVRSEEESLARLTEEYRAVTKGGADLFEDVGNGRARLNLASTEAGRLPLCAINRMFVYSSGTSAGSMERFHEKLEVLRTLAREGLLPFSGTETEAYLGAYKKAGYPAVSHSEDYRKAYRPAYRLIDARFCRLFPVLVRLLELMKKRERVTVALDGNAAAGKSTAAELIVSALGGDVIHTDDFFLPPALRTPERYAEPGGNLHYERFRDEVLAGLELGELFTYRVFDCSVMDYAGSVTLRPGALTVIEGSYSLHPRFGSAYDLRVFLSLDAARQRERIIARNGEDGFRMFEEKWIPLENRYFEAFRIAKSCDFVLN